MPYSEKPVVKCEGTEARLIDCHMQGETTCQFGEAAGVICNTGDNMKRRRYKGRPMDFFHSGGVGPTVQIDLPQTHKKTILLIGVVNPENLTQTLEICSLVIIRFITP